MNNGKNEKDEKEEQVAELLDNAPIRICDKCLAQFNEFQDMIKEKEKYFHSNLKQQKITSKLSQGYKIKNSNSQIFINPLNDDNEFEERKEEQSPIDDSSRNSSSRANSNFMTPESRNEFQQEVRNTNDGSDNFELKMKPFKKVGFSGTHQDSSRPDRASGESEDRIDTDANDKSMKVDDTELDEAYYIKENNLDESELSLAKVRSENKISRKIKEEMEEYAYNMHADEYIRQQEIDNWSPKKQELYENLDRLINKHVGEIIDYVFQEKELQEIFQSDERENAQQIWRSRFKEFTLKAIRLVKPSQRLMKDTMDINDYIEIELIDHEDDSKCKYINGCVIKNNIADRRMRSDIKDPKILLIGNSIGLCQEESCVDIETYVSQEKHYIDILMDRLNQVNPNLILVEKDISRAVLGKIRELNITVITNVKRSNIEKIARCTETLIIPSVNLIEKHLNLGSCKRFYLKMGQIKNIKEESNIMRITQSLLYFDGCKPWYGSTICLSGPNNRHLNTIKSYIQKVLKYSKDLVLEKEYLFLSDGYAKNENESPYLLPKIGIGKSSLKYIKISIRQSLKDDASESIINDGNHEDKQSEEGDNVQYESEAQIRKNMHHLCGKPFKKNIEFYSPNDMTLGQYLRATANEALEKCEYCREKMYKHVTDIYHGEGYIEISVSIKGNRYLYQKLDEKDYDKNTKAKENNMSKIKDLISIDASDAIMMYEECKKCKSLVIEKKTINSDLQEYSFTKFIEQYFYNPEIVVQHTEDHVQELVKEDASSSSDNLSNHSQSN